MKNIIFILSFLTITLNSIAQRQHEYKVSLSGQIADKKNLPMWATTNKFGIVPDSRGGLLQLGFFSDFNTQKKIRLAYGISGVGYFTQAKNKAILDELYMSAKWEKSG